MSERHVGLQSSMMCTKEVSAFMQCQRQNGFIGKICGACMIAREAMDRCLDEESLTRKRQNAESSRLRMNRYEQSKEN